jgi:hypothetical protein
MFNRTLNKYGSMEVWEYGSMGLWESKRSSVIYARRAFTSESTLESEPEYCPPAVASVF